MTSALDVAAYILRKQGPMTAMKLQKLVYYSQAWHLVWEERRLFEEAIEAWANGPVVRELYLRHRGLWQLDASTHLGGNPDAIDAGQRETVDVVLKSYGDKPAHWLSELTHREEPWLLPYVRAVDPVRGSTRCAGSACRAAEQVMPSGLAVPGHWPERGMLSQRRLG